MNVPEMLYYSNGLYDPKELDNPEDSAMEVSDNIVDDHRE